MPRKKGRRRSIKNEKQYEAVKRKGMSKQRAASISNAGKAGARKGGRKSGGRGGRTAGLG